MARFNFAGGSYQTEGLGFDCQRSVNLYAELHELGDGFSKMAMLYTPGLKSFATLDGIPRGQIEYNGRHFIAGAQNLYESTPSFNADGTLASISLTVRNVGTPLLNDNKPVSMAANEFQLLLSSGGNVYLLNLNTNAFSQVAPSNFTLSTGPAPVTQVAFSDSFFLALIANSQTIQISNVLDGGNWNTNGQLIVSVFPENIVSMWVDHREVWLMSNKHIAVYIATGSLNVFDVQPGGYIEEGAGAQFATRSLDNSIFWISSSERGNAQAFRANGYTPQRVSTDATELAWQTYPKISDAVAYTYQERGHNFWVIFFPSANGGRSATWVYDTATQLWHERDQTIAGLSYGHPSWNHAFVYNQHFVGDWRSNKLYVMSKKYFDNDGSPIIKVRTCPHIFTEQERIDHHRFELACDMGVGWASDDPAHQVGGLPVPPQVFLDWSNDGGKTWSNAQGRSFGFLGETRLPRPVWRRLGQARTRTYRVTCSESVPVRMYDAFVNADPGFQPTERLTHQIRKSA